DANVTMPRRIVGFARGDYRGPPFPCGRRAANPFARSGIKKSTALIRDPILLLGFLRVNTYFHRILLVPTQAPAAPTGRFRVNCPFPFVTDRPIGYLAGCLEPAR